MAPQKASDSIQERLTDYAHQICYDKLPAETIHAAKVRIIDTLGALVGGFFAEPCLIARKIAAANSTAVGASIIGTRTHTTAELAAYANGTASRYVEINDIYLWPGGFGGHPSDVVTPLLGVAEVEKATGKEYIASVVLAYEIYQRFSDIFHNKGFDQTNFCCLATSIGAGKLLGLSRDQLAQCIAIAAVHNNVLRQVRLGHLSMYKTTATGHAAHAGIFAAIVARAGMEGPHLPFEGESGWCKQVARESLSFGPLGGDGAAFKIGDSQIKLRPANGLTIAAILAAEKIAPVSPRIVEKVVVEVHKYAKDRVARGSHNWNPESRETADHSIPYLVAATLMDGTITAKSFNDAHLWNEDLRALMQKIEVIENDEFTNAYNKTPREHCMRVTVTTSAGERMVGATEGGADSLAGQKTDAQIEAKFRKLTEDAMGPKQTDSILSLVWNLESVQDVSALPEACVFA